MEPARPEAAPVLVIGPGAIGTIVAARLAARGHPVTVACRTRGTAETITRQGLVAVEVKGRTLSASVAAVHKPRRLSPEPRLAVLATKCQDALTALESWTRHLPNDCPVVAMQNGMMGDRLAPAAQGRVVECVVAFPATLEGSGRSRQTGPGGFILGEWPEGAPTPRVQEAARILSAAGPVRTTKNMRGAKWTKLIINSCITTLGVLTNTTLGELLKGARARDAFLAVATEGYRSGRADGVRFEPIQGFRPFMFALPQRGGRFARAWRHQLLRVLARKQGRHRSSSLQSLERGAKTEVDFLNGALVEAAGRRGIPAPVNEALVRLVHEIEGGGRRPGLENLADAAGGA